MKNFGSVNIVYDISNLIVQNQTVEGSEHKRYNKIVRFVTTNLVKKNSNQSINLKALLTLSPYQLNPWIHATLFCMTTVVNNYISNLSVLC